MNSEGHQITDPFLILKQLH